MAKMWKRIPNMLVIIVLVALLGGIDVLFGCCAIRDDSEVTTPLNQAVTQIPHDVEHGSNRSVAGGGRKCGFLGNWKVDALTVVLFVVALVFGFVLFVNVASTAVKKGDIVGRARKLDLTLHTPSNSQSEKIAMVQNLLCKCLPGSNVDPPLNSSTTTKYSNAEIATNANSPTSDSDSRITTTVESDTTVANISTDIAASPMERAVLTTEDPNAEECKTRAETVFDRIFKFVQNLYIGTVQLSQLPLDDQNAVRKALTNINDYNCGDNFFALQTSGNSEEIYFRRGNNVVDAAINNITCQKAAIAAFPLLEELGADLESNLTQTYENENYIYSHVRPALNIAYDKDCGDGWFTLSYPNEKGKITYTAENSHYSTALKKYKSEKQCRQAAEEVVKIINAVDRYDVSPNSNITIPHVFGFRDTLTEFSDFGCQHNCGTGFFEVKNNTSNVTLSYQDANPYMHKAFMKVNLKNSCNVVSREVFGHLRSIGVYTADTDANLVIPNHNDDIRTLIELLKPAARLDCEAGFFSFSKTDDFVLSYETDNYYIGIEKVKMTDHVVCNLKARGIYLRLTELNKFRCMDTMTITVRETETLRKELKDRMDSIPTSGCGNSFFTYEEYTDRLKIKYSCNNEYIQSQVDD